MPYDFLSTLSLLLFLNGAFLVALAVYVFSYRRNNVTNGLIGILVGAAVWSIADGIRIAAAVAEAVIFWNKVSYIGVAIIPPAVVLFVAGFTDHERSLLHKKFRFLLAISAVMVATVFTNPWHGLWRSGEEVSAGSSPPVLVEYFGTAHVLWDAYVLLVIVPLSYVFMAKAYRNTDLDIVRKQVLVFMVAFLAPSLTAGLYVSGAVSVDPTPFGFGAFGVMMVLALARYRGVDIVPIARNSIVESVDVGVFVLDSEDRIVDANPAAASIVNVTRRELIGRQATDVFAEYESAWNELREREDASTTITLTADDDPRHYQVNISPIREDDSTRRGRILIFDEITEKIHREETLVERAERLERKNERLDQFASMVSHDLQNPLNVASLRIEEASKTGDTSELDAAREALDRVEDMTDQLLTLARTEDLPAEREAVPMRELVHRATVGVDADRLEIDLDGAAGEVVGDPSLLVQLFENLFDNAVEHNGSGVSITVGRLDSATGEGFYVADSGNGIDPPEDESVFEYGYSGDDRGTGIGLAIVRDIVEAHGWEISWTESEDGGTRFEIITDPEADDRVHGN